MSALIKPFVLALAVAALWSSPAGAQGPWEGAYLPSALAEAPVVDPVPPEVGPNELALRVGRTLGTWGRAARARLEGWGIPPVVAILGSLGLSLIAWGGRSVLEGRRGAGTRPTRWKRGASRASRVRPPRPPTCRDAARLQEALRSRKVA